jgi:hypothetical protein
MHTLHEQLKAALRAATPLAGVSSYDPAATITDLATNVVPKDYAVIEWDHIRGLVPRNDLGTEALTKIESLQTSVDPVEMLLMLEKMPARTVVFMINGQLFSKPDKTSPAFIQAFWNLRDQFKVNNRMVVMVGTQIVLPIELQQDTLLLGEPLPSDGLLRAIVTGMCEDNEIAIAEETVERAVDALRGLAAFPAEQAVAMSLTREGLDVEGLLERKRAIINQAPGLTVYEGGQKFDDLGGLHAIKERFKRIIEGKKRPRVIVWLDEIEKAMSGSDSGAGDSSGTSQDQLGVLLSVMQDSQYDGSILFGVPGAAKSAFAKAVANEAGCLTVRLDLGAMKGQFVGQSEERIRHAMNVVNAVAGDGGAFFIATSNDMRAIKPELKRRFKKGIWFFDTPTPAERDRIWEIHIAKVFGEDQVRTMMHGRPEDDGWTGAEIETCVQTAWEEDVSLKEASRGIIPVTVAGAADIERMRAEADGKYSSVTHQGPYKRSLAPTKGEAKAGKRSLNLG